MTDWNLCGSNQGEIKICSSATDEAMHKGKISPHREGEVELWFFSIELRTKEEDMSSKSVGGSKYIMCAAVGEL